MTVRHSVVDIVKKRDRPHQLVHILINGLCAGWASCASHFVILVGAVDRGRSRQDSRMLGPYSPLGRGRRPDENHVAAAAVAVARLLRVSAVQCVAGAGLHQIESRHCPVDLYPTSLGRRHVGQNGRRREAPLATAGGAALPILRDLPNGRSHNFNRRPASLPSPYLHFGGRVATPVEDGASRDHNVARGRDSSFNVRGCVGENHSGNALDILVGLRKAAEPGLADGQSQSEGELARHAVAHKVPLRGWVSHDNVVVREALGSAGLHDGQRSHLAPVQLSTYAGVTGHTLGRYCRKESAGYDATPTFSCGGGTGDAVGREEVAVGWRDALGFPRLDEVQAIWIDRDAADLSYDLS